MSASNDQIIEKIREYRKRSGKTQADLAELLGKTTASISDLERGKVQVSAVELFQIADYLKIPIEYFFTSESFDQDVLNVITSIKEQPKEARLNSFEIVKLYMEIQGLSKKILNDPNKEYPPEELGDIVTKILKFQSHYKMLTSKLDSTIKGLIDVLYDHGISLPKS